MKTDKFMRRMRRLSVVPRWVIVPTLKRQTVDAHSFHTTWIFVWVAAKKGFEVTVEDLLYVMAHDADEAVTGDVPSPAKRRATGASQTHGGPDIAADASDARGTPSRGETRHALLKVADTLEAALFLYEEHIMGNKALHQVANDVNVSGDKWARKLDLDWFSIMNELLTICDPTNHPGLEA